MTIRILLASFLVATSYAFYLPGVAPRSYAEGEAVEIKVQNLDSTHTQLPYDYYSLGFCQPDELKFATENLGEVLHGDDIQNSPYEASMQQSEACKILCKVDLTKEQVLAFMTRIKEGYRANWILDNLPAGTKQYYRVKDPNKADVTVDGRAYMVSYGKGFPIGFMGGEEHHGGTPGVTYLNNHHRLVIDYHEDPESFEGYRIVGFEVDAFSVDHETVGDYSGQSTLLKTCSAMHPVTTFTAGEALTGEATSVIWTYDVKWDKSDLKWASRWDLYLRMAGSDVHWFSIINSMVFVMLLSGLVAMVMLRTLYKDFREYNELIEMTEEEKEEETGWKLVHGDVFRPPQYGWLLAVLAGTGVQLFCMVFVTLAFAVLGFLSPANRGGLMTALLVLFVLMGFFAGYHSVRLYRLFGLENWRGNATLTATLVPGIVFATFFLLNLMVWGEKSTGAVPFSTLLLLLVLWFCVSYPLVILGGFVASKREVTKNPTRTNNIARPIPEARWYTSGWVTTLLGGLLPFGAIFMETFFILTSVWQHRFYYVFGFLALVFLILVITCAEIAIVLCYNHLTAMDYHWWWRSFLIGPATSFYVFLYSAYYFVTKAEITGFVPVMVFFGYTLLGCMCLALVTGTVSFFSTLWFVRKIYSVVKID